MFPNQSSTSVLSNKGVCDWKQLGIRLKDHETSSAHGSAQMQLLELQKRLHYEKIIFNKGRLMQKKNIGVVF
jgi:hypothetical protein